MRWSAHRTRDSRWARDCSSEFVPSDDKRGGKVRCDAQPSVLGGEPTDWMQVKPLVHDARVVDNDFQCDPAIKHLQSPVSVGNRQLDFACELNRSEKYRLANHAPNLVDIGRVCRSAAQLMQMMIATRRDWMRTQNDTYEACRT